jgi:hypothetical protein
VKANHHRALATCIGLGLALFATGCPNSDLEFRVCGDLVVPDDIDGFRLLILDQDRHELHSGVRSLVEEDSAVDQLPLSASLPNGSGPGWAKIQGLLAGVAVITFERQIGKLEDTAVADMVLTADCVGQDCPLGQTCVAGTCILAPVNAEDPICGGTF